ncbi:hypothetical protein SELMODRAFT_411576 [Selaginella moellendorffii]|uniref:Uncharacterized protein n=1 Tax=Selaginella moellendorffii TaxID=88036 RepID=D8RID3_SELML|nr:hypothetical protein SELMODRAFT_411576 [Selaginella moellendorffii]
MHRRDMLKVVRDMDKRLLTTGLPDSDFFPEEKCLLETSKLIVGFQAPASRCLGKLLHYQRRLALRSTSAINPADVQVLVPGEDLLNQVHRRLSEADMIDVLPIPDWKCGPQRHAPPFKLLPAWSEERSIVSICGAKVVDDNVNLVRSIRQIDLLLLGNVDLFLAYRACIIEHNSQKGAVFTQAPALVDRRK